MSDDGWQVEARPAPPELAEGFPRADYVTPEPLHSGVHIRDWASFMELVGSDGMKLLMQRATIGEPDAGTTHTL